MQILEELYFGHIQPCERRFKRDSQYAQALSEAIQTEEALNSSINDDQKKLFESFKSAQREVNVLTDAETFTSAFQLGAKIMMDVLVDGPLNRI